MRFELWFFGIIALILYNAYHDGKYTKMLFSYKKYFTMGFIALLTICFYLMVKRNPNQTKNLLLYTHNMIKYMPIDKSSVDLISPIFDLSTKTKGFMEEMEQQDYYSSPAFKHKRSVSETKKKLVASNQNWKCGECGSKLSHTYEVDHKVRLDHGGNNDVSNLVALCRECHGNKTAMENM